MIAAFPPKLQQLFYSDSTYSVLFLAAVSATPLSPHTLHAELNVGEAPCIAHTVAQEKRMNGLLIIKSHLLNHVAMYTYTYEVSRATTIRLGSLKLTPTKGAS